MIRHAIQRKVLRSIRTLFLPSFCCAPGRRGGGLALLRGACLIVCAAMCGMNAAQASDGVLTWKTLPAIPDREGFAAPFAGSSNEAIIVAGGANFPDARPWEGGTKVWYDTVFVLEPKAAAWKTGFKLERAVAYGVSLSTPQGVACLGGGNADEHFRDAFLISYRDRSLHFQALPPLPEACAFHSGAMLGDRIYLAGGIRTPTATTALKSFWSLDLKAESLTWQVLEPWPGPERMLAVAGAQDGAFFLMGGVKLTAGPDGKPVREHLRDAYRYDPGSGWKRIADMPRAATAAPSPAIALGQSHLYILGGDDGMRMDFAPPEKHPGFPGDILSYQTTTNAWFRAGEVPFSLVTTPAFRHGEAWIVPGGEARPGVRSPEVWSATARRQHAGFGWLDYATLVTYLLGMVAIGLWCTRRGGNTSDYFVGGGRIPWWAAGLSIYATMLSALTFMAIPAKAYATNWTFFWANVPILVLAPMVIRVYLPFFRQLQVASAYEYLERRFNLTTRLYGSSAFVLYQFGRMAIVLYLPALALSAVSSIDIRVSIISMGLLCVIYTTFGGIEAVIWTDVAQSIVLLGAAAAALVIAVAQAGGWSQAWQIAVADDKLRLFDFALDPTQPTLWVVLVGNLFINLIPYTSDQTVIQRYLTTTDESRSARAIWTNALLAIPSTALFFAIGTALYVNAVVHPERIDPTLGADSIFPQFIMHSLPTGLAGLAVAGIFAAAQSTLSSSLNSVSTVLVTDFYKRFRPAASDAVCLRLAQKLTAIIGVVATALALMLASTPIVSLWDLFNSMLGLLGSGLAGLFALGIFTKRAHGTGVLCGAAASAIALVLVQQYTSLHFFLYAGVGISVCFIVGYAASCVLPAGAARPLDRLTIYTQRMHNAPRATIEGTAG